MYRDHTIVVVVPTYNEERHIAGVITSMPDFVDHIVVVDDCSRDDTSRVAGNVNDKRVTLLSTARNSGVGGATVVGYKKGQQLEGDILVKMDGDGQMLPEYLNQLLDAIIDGGYDYAKGNRFLLPEYLPQMPPQRLLGNVALTFMTKCATGYWNVFDPQNGYTAIKGTALARVDLNKIHKRFFFENDMLWQLGLWDARVKDVAIPAKYGAEVSSLSPLRIIMTFPQLLLKRWLSRVWHKYVLIDFSAIALFLLLGFMMFAWGFVFGAFLWIRSAITGDPSSTGSVMLCVLPLILGFQLLLQAIVLDIARTPK
jgi:glycosyltransferase involved in cell wall biosynthesis